MMYFRGDPQDYENWPALGATGWNWKTIKRSFEAFENINGQGKGALDVSIERRPTAISRIFIQTANRLGVPEVPDLNHEGVEGVGYVSTTTHKGRRVSAATAFLKPALNRRNLHVVKNALVDRVLFDDKRATRVIAEVDGREVTYSAQREVILSAGAMVTPQILQRSGIGAPDLLAKHNIPVVHASPRVGANLIEHIGIQFRYRLNREVSENPEYRGWRLLKNTLQYYLFRTGPMGRAPFDCALVAKTDPSIDRPDIQINTNPSTATMRANGKIETDPFPGLSLYVYPLRPLSQGRVEIRSRNPKDKPIIIPNILSNQYDRDVSVASLRYIRKLVKTPPLSDLIAEEIFPGEAEMNSDDEIVQAFRTRGIPYNHACSSVAMGGEDAPLDEQMRVRGVSRLRVIDGSALPAMPSANTNGPIMAMAWHAADLVLSSRND